MGSGYGACEDRGCGNVGSVQEVSTHTLMICYIDHPSTVHSIEVAYSRFSPVGFRPGLMAGLFNTTNKHQYLLCNHKCHALQNASQILELIIPLMCHSQHGMSTQNLHVYTVR